MILPFVKMHGAGNDFVVVSGIPARLAPLADVPRMAALCARRTGVGSEGLIALLPPDDPAQADVRMLFLNPDGKPAEMCGNGARCAALEAHRLGLGQRSLRMQTGAGVVEADILDPAPAHGRVRITLGPPPSPVRLEVLGLDVLSINTGVPHAVVFVEDAESVDVDGLGRALRRHAAFAPAGTNVDFAQVLGSGALRLRTYERGVEAESGACGTGALAAAVAHVAVHAAAYPVSVRVSSGDEIAVGLSSDGRLTLTGPAREVFEGSIDLDALLP